MIAAREIAGRFLNKERLAPAALFADEDSHGEDGEAGALEAQAIGQEPGRRRCALLGTVASGVQLVGLLLVLVAVALVAILSPLRTFRRPPPQTPEQKQLLFDGSVCTFDRMGTCPALTLFENPEVHEVAMEGLMLVGEGLLAPEDRPMVRQTVAANFRNISAQLRLHAPTLADELHVVPIGESQKNAVLSLLQLISDPRVRTVGLDVARAIRESAGTPAAMERQYIKRYIELSLAKKLGGLQTLRDEIVPDSLLRVWGAGNQWDMTLDPENIRSMQAVRGEFDAGFMPGASADPAQKSRAILAGVLEEGRALIDAIKLCARLTGRELTVPAWAASPLGARALDAELSSCGLDAAQEDVRTASTRSLFCPLKFGAQGVEALRAVSEMKLKVIAKSAFWAWHSSNL